MKISKCNQEEMDLCKLCDKTFSKKSNLIRHMKNVHSTIGHEKFICYHCSQNFRQKSNLVKHLATCESNKKKKNTTKNISCCLCNEAEIPKHAILEHYSCTHDLDLTMKKLKFDSYDDFEQWKDKLETDTVSKYTRFDKSRSKTNVVYYYHCHRDGFFTSRGQNMKHLKLLGSNKINGHCPAKIRLSVSQETGKASVDFLPTHVGHSNTDFEKIPLKKAQRELVAAKILQKIPFDEILDQVRDNADENHFERLHLLTRKDLFNIEREFNIDNSVRQSNEKNAASVVWSRSIDVGVNMDHSTDQVMKVEVEDDDLNYKLLKDENPETAEQKLNFSHLTSEVDKRKTKIAELFQAHLDCATTSQHCKVIENALLSIGPTFLAMQSKRTASTRISRPKTNIESQARKLFSTN